MLLFLLGCHSLHATVGLIQADEDCSLLPLLSIIKGYLCIRLTSLKKSHYFEGYHIMLSYKIFWENKDILKIPSLFFFLIISHFPLCFKNSYYPVWVNKDKLDGTGLAIFSWVIFEDWCFTIPNSISNLNVFFHHIYYHLNNPFSASFTWPFYDRSAGILRVSSKQS